MVSALLALLAITFIVVAPRSLSRVTALRRRPRAGLWLWQTTAMAGVLCVLAAPPVAVRELATDSTSHDYAFAHTLSLLALVFSGTVVLRLLVNAHLVGTRLRQARARHRTLVDLIGEHHTKTTRVLPHALPTAYCVPGLRHRMVLTDATMQALEPDELQAVMAHEHAHLVERHDLLLEYFTVLHRTAPERMRSEDATQEVQLLIERLADEAARAKVGEVPLARALVRLAGAQHPEGALGIGSPASTAARMEMLATKPRHRLGSIAAYVLGVLALAAPVLLVALAWAG